MTGDEVARTAANPSGGRVSAYENTCEPGDNRISIQRIQLALPPLASLVSSLAPAGWTSHTPAPSNAGEMSVAGAESDTGAKTRRGPWAEAFVGAKDRSGSTTQFWKEVGVGAVGAKRAGPDQVHDGTDHRVRWHPRHGPVLSGNPQVRTSEQEPNQHQRSNVRATQCHAEPATTRPSPQPPEGGNSALPQDARVVDPSPVGPPPGKDPTNLRPAWYTFRLFIGLAALVVGIAFGTSSSQSPASQEVPTPAPSATVTVPSSPEPAPTVTTTVTQTPKPAPTVTVTEAPSPRLTPRSVRGCCPPVAGPVPVRSPGRDPLRPGPAQRRVARVSPTAAKPGQLELPLFIGEIPATAAGWIATVTGLLASSHPMNGGVMARCGPNDHSGLSLPSRPRPISAM